MASWEKEKAYCQRRADSLAAEMEASIEQGDKDRFLAAFISSRRYMSQKQRLPLYYIFLERNAKS